jgi:hypothetical protein
MKNLNKIIFFVFESEKQTLKKVIIIIIFIDCNWVDTRWQWLTKVIKNMGKNVLTTTKFGSFIAA